MLAVGGVAPATVQAAAVFKWIDRDGSVHYDDQHRLDQRLTWAYLNGRQVPARPDATTPPAFIAAVAADCRLARERAEVVRAASVIYGSDPGGNVYQLSPRQQQLELKMADRDAVRYCAPGAAESLYRELRAERDRHRQKPAPIVVEQRGP